ncbi:MAG: hypothetical protein IMF09_00445 [Proteobacteria bacterium]|nr:hypothetical protein [Pseudomonadota bacterium]
MKPLNNLSLLLAFVALSFILTACASTITEEELILVPETSTESIPSLEDGLKVEPQVDGEVDDED